MIYQWHIFIASLDPSKGSEQAGKRPVLVISREKVNQLLPVVNVIPLTSKKSPERKIFPNEVFIPAAVGGLKMESIALCYQIRTLDKTRLHVKSFLPFFQKIGIKEIFFKKSSSFS